MWLYGVRPLKNHGLEQERDTSNANDDDADLMDHAPQNPKPRDCSPIYCWLVVIGSSFP